MKDVFGIICSGLCVLHCSLSPVLLVLGLSTAGLSLFEHEWIHFVLAVPMFLLAIVSFPKSYQLHKHFLPLFMGCLGITLMLASMIGPHEYEVYFATLAGLILITAHVVNRRLLTRFYGVMQKKGLAVTA